VTTLDDLTPREVELAEDTCGDLPLDSVAPDHFLELLADRLKWRHPDLAGKLRGLSLGERTVLYDYLVDRAGQTIPVAA